MKNKFKKIFENAVWWSGVIMVGLILGISLQFVRAWTEPTEAPPGGNVGAPINTSAIMQWKGDPVTSSGSLGLYGVLDALAIKIRGSVPPQPGMVLMAQENPPGSGTSDGTAAWAAGGGGSGTCPAGFTNITNMGRHLGCIETSVHNEAEYISWWAATDECFADFGGRIPLWSEFYIASMNFSLIHLEHDDFEPYEWLGDGNSLAGTHFPISVWNPPALPIPSLSGDISGSKLPYRCWVPND